MCYLIRLLVVWQMLAACYRTDVSDCLRPHRYSQIKACVYGNNVRTGALFLRVNHLPVH